MSVGSISPFRPTGTVSLSVGSASVNTTLAGGGDSIVVTNTTNSLAYVRFGAEPSLTATLSDMPILPASQVILSVNSLITYVAAFSPSGTGVVLFSRGDGAII